MGIIYFLLYYSSFKYLILKYNLKTLGRSNNGKLLLQQDEKNFDVLTASKVIDGFNQQFYYIVKGLGGKNDLAKIDENILKKSGVIGIIYRELNIQLVFGLRHQT